MSSLTMAMRNDGACLIDLSEFQTMLVPYPRIHFMHSSLSPLYKRTTVLGPLDDTVNEVTQSAFNSNHFLSAPMETDYFGKYMACVFLFRGDHNPSRVNAALINARYHNRKRRMEFVDWCPTGFRCGINYQPITNFPDDDIART